MCSHQIHISSPELDCATQDYAEPNESLHRQIIVCKQERGDSMTKVN